MGGSKKKQTVGYKYYMGLHFALCYGPIDKFRKVLVGDRKAWSGSVLSSSQISINMPNLFGGDKREGGVVGPAAVMMGEQAQTLPSFVAALLPTPSPAFRGILSFFYNGLISANNPYVKAWGFQLQRITAGWSGGSAWYAAKSAIDVAVEPGSFVDDHVGGLSGYSVISGNPLPLVSFVSDTYGTALRFVPPATTTPGVLSIMRKTITAITASRIRFPLKVQAGNTDDAGAITFSSVAGVSRFSVSASRESAFDAQQRAVVSVAGGGTFFIGEGGGTARLTVGQWYEFDLQQVGANWTLSVKRLSDGVVVDTESGSGTIGEVGSISVGIDSDTRVQETRFGALQIYAQDPVAGMNGAHIIYQCLTDPQWGMGYPTATIDTTSFQAAADVLFSEGFGLCMIWNQQDEIGSFVRTVLDHIGGLVYTDPLTGKFALRLLRADYSVGSLETFDETKIVSLDDFQRVGYGETTNEITVVYRDVLTNKDVPITVHNLANIQAQGGVVSKTSQYPGLPNATLAARVAQRDLLASSTPLAKARITVNRSAWSLTPGAVFKLNWPKLGLSSVVMRVLAVNYGDLTDGTISADIAEDVFGLPANSYAVQQPTGWVEPDTQPALITLQIIVEAPYRSLVSEIDAANLALVDADAAYFSALAVAPNGTSLGMDVYSRVGAAAFELIETGSFIPTATISADLTQSSTSIVLATATDLEDVDIGSFAIVGTGRSAEWMLVKTVDTVTLTITVARGVLDTVPRTHAAGARIYFDDARSSFDPTERATGETVDFKLATLTSGGELDYTLATTISATADQRQYRPYAPGNVQINGVDYPTTVLVPFTVTWAHRDRLQQTAYTVEQSEASIGPEAGTTYNAYAYDDVSGSLLESLVGITGTSWSPALLGVFTLRVEIEAQRAGVVSWQRQTRTFTYNTGGRITEDGGDVDRVTENDELRSQE